MSNQPTNQPDQTSNTKPIISITIDEALLQRVDALAKEQRRSRSQTITLLIEKALHAQK